MRNAVKFRMDPMAKYEFEGEEFTWLWTPIEVEVRYNRNSYVMRKAAYNKIAKYITSHLSIFRKSQWIYINKIDFHIVNNKQTLTTRKKNYVPVVEYTDLFGTTKQILSNGKERIKPIMKGE